MNRSTAVLNWAAIFGLCILIGAVYYPVYWFDFLNFDDNVYITRNPHVISGLSWSNLHWAFTDSRTGHWHPLTWIAHMTTVELLGLNPGALHLVNVALHAVNVALVFIIFFHVSKARPAAFFAASIFGLHPMRLESVAWLSELKDVLSLFFALLTVIFYLYYCAHRTWWRYGLILLFFAMGLMAKPTILTLPVLLLLLDFWPLKRFAVQEKRWAAWYPLVREKIPLLFLSGASIAVTSIFQGGEGSIVSFAAIPLGSRIANGCVSYLAYFGKLFFPYGLGIFYPLHTVAFGSAVAAALTLCALTWICLRNIHDHPALAVGWLWFLIALSPVIGIFQFGGQAYADRWSYVPHLGLIAGLTWWGKVNLPLPGRVPHIICALLIVIMGLWTSRELPHWKDSVSIFRHTLEVSPDNFMAHTNLGTALEAQGNYILAVPHYEAAYRLNPTYPEAINNLGIVRARQGRLNEAVKLFQQALTIRPNFVTAKANRDLALHKLGRSR